LVGLITRRSQVQILPPPPSEMQCSQGLRGFGGLAAFSVRYRPSTDFYRLLVRVGGVSFLAMVGEELAECGCGVVLHSGEDVLVGRHRERRAGVSESFGDDLDRYPVPEQETGVGVS